jgi:hypothetical protein
MMQVHDAYRDTMVLVSRCHADRSVTSRHKELSAYYPGRATFKTPALCRIQFTTLSRYNEL